VRFDITDGAGKDRISLVATDDGSVVRLAGAGDRTASLLVASTGPALSLEEPTRRSQVAVGVAQKGAVITLSDQGQVGVAMATGSVGRGISISDANGKLVWSAPQ